MNKPKILEISDRYVGGELRRVITLETSVEDAEAIEAHVKSLAEQPEQELEREHKIDEHDRITPASGAKTE